MIEQAVGGSGVPDNGVRESSDDDSDDDTDAAGRSKLGVLLTIIAEDGRFDYGRVAEYLYGEDNAKTRKRLRSSLAYLKRTDRIRSTARGAWEVVR